MSPARRRETRRRTVEVRVGLTASEAADLDAASDVPRRPLRHRARW